MGRKLLVGVCGVRGVRGLLVMASVVMLRGFLVMAGRLFVMSSRFAVMV
jgi:hypothetical protein